MKTFVAAIVRAAVLVLAPVLLLAWLDRGMGASAGADIGGGAFALLLIAAIAAGWASYDAWRRPAGESLRLWTITVAIALVAWTIRYLVRGEPAFDLLVLVPMLAMTAGIPALVGGAVGQALGHRSSEAQS